MDKLDKGGHRLSNKNDNPDKELEKDENIIRDNRSNKSQYDIDLTDVGVKNKKRKQDNTRRRSGSKEDDQLFQDLYQTMIDKKLKSKSKREELKKQKKKKVAMIGFVILVFALVGVYNIGIIAFGEISDIVTGKNKLTKYEDFIKPVVLLDVVPFESVDKLDEKIKLQVGIWSIVMSGKTENYKKDETGAMFMPAVDIEAEVTRIFGTGQKFVHESFGDYASQFYFDDASNSYKIPVSGRVGYVPQVTKVEDDGNLKKLTVNYIPPNAWTGENKDGKTEVQVDKTLYYYLDNKDGNDFISKIELPKNQQSNPIEPDTDDKKVTDENKDDTPEDNKGDTNKPV